MRPALGLAGAGAPLSSLADNRWIARVLLGAIVVGGTLLAWHWVFDVDEWRVMPDEMGYLKVGQSMIETFSPRPDVRGVNTGNYGVLYSALLAPLLAVFDLPNVFRFAHALGALSMASAAIPVYLLTTYVSRSRMAGLVAAAPAALAPWLLLSLNLLTEVIAYPLFAWTAYAAVRAVAEPSVKRDAQALLCLVALVLARTQFVVLAPALPLAMVGTSIAGQLGGRSPRRWPRQIADGAVAAARAHTLVIAVLVGFGLLALVGVPALRLGGYGAVITDGSLFPAGFWASSVEHLNQILFGIAVVPFTLALAFVLDACRGSADVRARALAMWMVFAAPAVLFVGTTFDIRFALTIQQRYVFYILLLFLAAAAAFVAIGRRRVPLALASAVITVLLLRRSGFVLDPTLPVYASPSLPGWIVLNGRVGQIGGWFGVGDIGRGTALALVGAVATMVVAFLATSGRRTAALVTFGVGVTAWCLALTAYVGPTVLAEHQNQARTALGGPRPLDTRGWVDDAVGTDARVALLPTSIVRRQGAVIPPGGLQSQSTWWDAEYWNRSVRRSYLAFGSADYTAYQSDLMTVDRRTGRAQVGRGEVPYIVQSASDLRLGLDGKVVARYPRLGLQLVRPNRPYRARWTAQGVTDQGVFVEGKALEFAGFAPSGTGTRVQVALKFVGRTRGALTVVAGGSTMRERVFGSRTLRRTVCARPGSPGRLQVRGEGPTGPRLVDVRVSSAGRCRGRG